MKAKTKNQIKVVKLNKRIKPIGVTISNWAKENVLPVFAHRYKSGVINCLKCGNHWKSTSPVAYYDKIIETKCLKCNSKLRVVSTNDRVRKDENYFTQVTTIDNYQLIRTFMINANYKCRWHAKYTIQECFRIFINEKGKQEVIGLIKSISYYNSSWQGGLELRNPDVIDIRYNQEGLLYHKWKLQDYVVQKGFNAYVNDEVLNTAKLIISRLLISSGLETILKKGNINMFSYFLNRIAMLKNFWPTMKIVLKNDYPVESWGSYFDMIDALIYFDKDILNSKYICPVNFNESHDYWIKKKRKKLDKIRDIEIAKRNYEILQFEKLSFDKYENRMKVFLKLHLLGNQISIKPLLKIEDVKKAGELMHHCIFNSEKYWRESDNLLLGAYFKDKLIETAQYSIKHNQVVDCYGTNNKETKFHSDILDLINKNKKLISNFSKPKKPLNKVIETIPEFV